MVTPAGLQNSSFHRFYGWAPGWALTKPHKDIHLLLFQPMYGQFVSVLLVTVMLKGEPSSCLQLSGKGQQVFLKNLSGFCSVHCPFYPDKCSSSCWREIPSQQDATITMLYCIALLIFRQTYHLAKDWFVLSGHRTFFHLASESSRCLLTKLKQDLMGPFLRSDFFFFLQLSHTNQILEHWYCCQCWRDGLIQEESLLAPNTFHFLIMDLTVLLWSCSVWNLCVPIAWLVPFHNLSVSYLKVLWIVLPSNGML